MKLDCALLTNSLGDAGTRARELEQLGFDGVFSFDGPQEPFAPLVLAADRTRSVDLITGVAIALARSPMTVAQTAHDLHTFSEGRFVLGLGPQVRAHIERRFGCEGSRPVARMKEFVRALKAIWAAWNDGAPLAFEGEFYTHTLMPPIMNPGPTGFGAPPVLLAGVGPAMTAAAGEVADGILVHPFNTRASFDSVTLPSIRKGLDRSARGLDDFLVACQVLIVTGADEQEYLAALEAVRYQIAFYASTRAYRPVLEAEGCAELQTDLHAMSKTGRWLDMANAVPEALVKSIAVCGLPLEAGRALRERFPEAVNRIGLASPYRMSAPAAREFLAGFRGDAAGA